MQEPAFRSRSRNASRSRAAAARKSGTNTSRSRVKAKTRQTSGSHRSRVSKRAASISRRKPAARRRRRRFTWESLTARELLDVRLCDLDVRIEGTWLEEPIQVLGDELRGRNIRVQPHVWLGEEWFCPDGVAGISIPFYLAHPRLMRVERSKMQEVEGGTRRQCLQLLRHEAGHAVHHAFKLQRRRAWTNMFGKSSETYPDYYQPNPASKRFVQYLDLWYAQSHPDEDFAETFAVWLDPRSNWQRRYRGWPALKKLEFVDELMEELAGKGALVRSRQRVEPVSQVKKTLWQYYRDKQQRYSTAHTNIYDTELAKLFRDGATTRRGEPATKFLRRNQREIRGMVSTWAGEHRVAMERVLQEMTGRCRELKLRAVGPERKLKLSFAILLTVKTMQYLYRRREWHTL